MDTHVHCSIHYLCALHTHSVADLEPGNGAMRRSKTHFVGRDWGGCKEMGELVQARSGMAFGAMYHV